MVCFYREIRTAALSFLSCGQLHGGVPETRHWNTLQEWHGAHERDRNWLFPGAFSTLLAPHFLPLPIF